MSVRVPLSSPVRCRNVSFLVLGESRLPKDIEAAIDFSEDSRGGKLIGEISEVVIVCDTRPLPLIDFVNWLKENPNTHIRKLVIPYSDLYDSYGEHELNGGDDSMVVIRGSCTSFHPSRVFKISPRLDRSRERWALENRDALNWPRYDDMSTESIIADASSSYRKWTTFQPRLGKSGLCVLFERYSKGHNVFIEEILQRCVVVTGLPYRIIHAAFHSCCPFQSNYSQVKDLQFDLPFPGIYEPGQVKTFLLGLLGCDVVGEDRIKEEEEEEAEAEVEAEVEVVPVDPEKTMKCFMDNRVTYMPISRIGAIWLQEQIYKVQEPNKDMEELGDFIWHNREDIFGCLTGNEWYSNLPKSPWFDLDQVQNFPVGMVRPKFHNSEKNKVRDYEIHDEVRVFTKYLLSYPIPVNRPR